MICPECGGANRAHTWACQAPHAALVERLADADEDERGDLLRTLTRPSRLRVLAGVESLQTPALDVGGWVACEADVAEAIEAGSDQDGEW